jgi:hypothetical protein
LEAAAEAAARSFYKYFIVLLLPEFIDQYSVASIQWKVDSGKWEAIDIKDTIAARQNRQYSST